MPTTERILYLQATTAASGHSRGHAYAHDHTPEYSYYDGVSNRLGSNVASGSSNITASLNSVVDDLTTLNGTTTTSTDCGANGDEQLHASLLGVPLAVPEWEALLTACVLSVIIVLTIIGNILVILSVFTYKPLRIVQNFFIVSLAVADLTVALLVLPFNVAYSILGRWEFGIHMCKMWLTCDVMCCTSSILNLCAIALDRYWAITDPINYAQKRTVGRVLLLIAGVWILSLLISSPPLVGWNDWPEQFTSATPCELNSDRGYVIYSALGSFFIPLAIMTIVYVEIYIATRRRLRERAHASKINAIALRAAENETANVDVTLGGQRRLPFCGTLLCCSIDRCSSQPSAQSVMRHVDVESISSETRANNEVPTTMGEQRVMVLAHTKKKTRRPKIKDSIKQARASAKHEKENLEPAQLPAPSKACKNEEDLPAAIPQQQQQPQPQVYIEVCVPSAELTLTNEVEKITPPQSSAGATSMLATPLSKKPTGLYQFIEEKQKISLSKERRAARTLGIIMGVFVICWLPFFLMYVILPFCATCCPTNKFKNFITWLGYINSGLNPVIYTIFNLDYRRAFKRLLGIK